MNPHKLSYYGAVFEGRPYVFLTLTFDHVPKRKSDDLWFNMIRKRLLLQDLPIEQFVYRWLTYEEVGNAWGREEIRKRLEEEYA